MVVRKERKEHAPAQLSHAKRRQLSKAWKIHALGTCNGLAEGAKRVPDMRRD